MEADVSSGSQSPRYQMASGYTIIRRKESFQRRFCGLVINGNLILIPHYNPPANCALVASLRGRAKNMCSTVSMSGNLIMIIITSINSPRLLCCPLLPAAQQPIFPAQRPAYRSACICRARQKCPMSIGAWTHDKPYMCASAYSFFCCLFP
ncbi:hypothetical protein CI102_5444 [Trichoderma harzianum]|nr:hypothetical protein CI102_5444 [Trichoderma harzianum]